MPNEKKTIMQIKRTLESVVGNELIPGRDENGDFKIEIQKLLLGFENYISETPAPKKVPRSDESGKLDIGWFDATETPGPIPIGGVVMMTELSLTSNPIYESFLYCDGSSISRTTYSVLYNVITKDRGTVTISIASPGVVTLNNHGFTNGDCIELTTTDTLPTGLTAHTNYYIEVKDANTFYLHAARSTALAGTAGNRINTSGTQSGAHSLRHCPFGVDGENNYLLPNFKSVVPRGLGQQSINGNTKDGYGLGTLLEDRIQNMTGSVGKPWETFGQLTKSGVFNNSSVYNPASSIAGGAGAYVDWITINFNASLVARTGDYTRDNSLSVRFYIRYK